MSEGRMQEAKARIPYNPPTTSVHLPFCILYLTPRKELLNVYSPLLPSSALCLTLILYGQGCFMLSI